MKQEAFIRDGDRYIRTAGEYMIMSINDFVFRQRRNNFDQLTKDKIRDVIQSCQIMEHRMEYVARVRGVTFINDSKSCNINATWYALETMDRPVILIIGGMDKCNDYSFIGELVRQKVRAMVCLGADNSKIHQAFRGIINPIVQTGGAVEAVHAAYHFAEKGDVVLLSPACASFDRFKNYEDRGNQFKKAVLEL